MPEPEISHRCSSCGVSVRGHALFCPECGHPLAQSGKLANQDAAGQQQNDGSPGAAGKPAGEAISPAAAQAAPSGEGRNESRVRDRTGIAITPTASKARKQIQRATTAARDALEDNVGPRVKKIRQASSVVLEEAAYDASLRFILVAAALFVLFIVLLVVSKVI